MTKPDVRYDPAIPCTICQGTGKAYVEHPDGTLTETECGYCKGTGNSAWVDQRVWSHQYTNHVAKVGIVAYLVLLLAPIVINFLSVSVDGPPWAFAMRCLAWGLGIFGLFWIYMNPKARKHRRAPKHAPGFTEDRERLAGGAFLGGVLLKGKWDEAHKKPGV